MNIAVNTRFLLKDKLEGIGWFTFETLKRITHGHPEHQFYFLFDRTFPDEFIFSGNITPLILHPQARHPVLFYLWFEHAVPKALKKVSADLFISTDGFLSLKTNVRTLLVIHDIAFEHFPDTVGKMMGWYLRKYSPQYARKAERIATVSEFSKRDIVATYGIAPEKIDVVYNGIRENCIKPPTGSAHGVFQKFGLTHPYFLYAGAIQPRKNIVNLLRAFDEFKANARSAAQLVIAGRKAWKFDDVMQTHQRMNFKEDVKFTGHLAAEDLAALMYGALALVYVSKFEGFGIPVIEAMSCGTPVITSNVSSMPEVAGDAALLVNPDSVDEIAGAMEKIFRDARLRKVLIAKGNVQRQKFSWDKTAEKLWASAERIMSKEKIMTGGESVFASGSH
ncbi:MAG TPA: glycosyltransferase family 1 protein [Chitinophagales bacterium]|nr:glycosyltransferase family 1 protein [Chitinophagales bacterium]